MSGKPSSVLRLVVATPASECTFNNLSRHQYRTARVCHGEPGDVDGRSGLHFRRESIRIAAPSARSECPALSTGTEVGASFRKRNTAPVCASADVHSGPAEAVYTAPTRSSPGACAATPSGLRNAPEPPPVRWRRGSTRPRPGRRLIERKSCDRPSV